MYKRQDEELDLQRQALAKAINHLSWQRNLVQPKAVDEKPSTIFVVDIRELGWDNQPFKIDARDGSSQIAALNIFDLVLIEYPYSTIRKTSNAFKQIVESQDGVHKPAVPIPHVRIDWFVSHALQPPLYEDILGLPRTLKEFGDLFDVDTEQELKRGQLQRAGMAVSGVSKNNRVVEHYEFRERSQTKSFWGSVDYATSRGQDSVFREPVNLRPGGGEFIVTMPNDLQAYFICDPVGNRIDEAPTFIVTDRFAQDRVVRNGLACMRCHANGIQRFDDDVRASLLSLPDTSHIDKEPVSYTHLTLPTICSV